ncbi:MAG: EF2563 family selenium-dependent molybdenum hydroxylase system protein [Chloroflexi bacterium]|nr:EF2563 family selenium-dependent molybdenum hydroxylase system protein [Chloroflexota bacterium]
MVVLIRGAGELASGVAHRLARSHFKVCLTEIPYPQAVRRETSFCEAVYDGEKEVEGVVARLVQSPDEIPAVWQEGKVPLLIDPEARVKNVLKPDVLLDAIIAKKNLGTRITDAPLVIGLGPGFQAGKDVHLVVETNRGHNLGRVISEGEAEANTGVPGEIAGVTAERVLHAPKAGKLSTSWRIGDHVEAGEAIGRVDGSPVVTLVGGVIRGLLRDGAEVHRGMKMGDVDPRGIEEYCYTVSDKARAIAGGVLEAILSRLNQ